MAAFGETQVSRALAYVSVLVAFETEPFSALQCSTLGAERRAPTFRKRPRVLRDRLVSVESPVNAENRDVGPPCIQSAVFETSVRRA